MAENSLVDSKLKGMTHSVPVNPLNHLHIEEPTGYLFNWFAYTLKNSADWKNFEHCSAVNGWSGEDSLLQACVVKYKSSLMVFLIETVEFMPLKLEFPFDAEK